MSDQQTSGDPRKSTPGRPVWLVPALLFLAYTLSCGPVAGLCETKYLPDEVMLVYEPIRLICQSCDPLMKALVLYCGFWRKLAAAQ